MALEWMQREKKEDQKAIELKPEDIQKLIKPDMDKLKTDMDAALDAKLAPMNQFFKEQKEAREEAARRQAAADKKGEKEKLEVSPEDWITDPEEATRKTVSMEMGNLKEVVGQQSAIIIRDKVLGKMDYYSSDPAFQSKVDALIDSQPLANRANSQVVMNAYKSVHYDMRKEIEEGKVKSLASMTSLNGGRQTVDTDNKDGKDAALSAEEKNYAAKMGLTEKQWQDGKRELEYV